MSKFEECIIHIGVSKTGTSTLQNFFFKNKSNLKEKSIFYPIAFGKRQHHGLVKYVHDKNKTLPLRIFSRYTNFKLEDYQKEINNSFREEIQNSNCRKLLISSEGLAISNDKEIRSLKKFFDNYVSKYKIIVYLRPQVDRIFSSYTSKLEKGITKKKIIPYKSVYDDKQNYEKMLIRWGNVFGSENLVPRIFSREDFPSGDVKLDFLSILGLNMSDFDDVENARESINVDAQRFLFGINEYLPDIIGETKNKYRGNLGNLVQSFCRGKGLGPTRKQAEEISKIYAESNEQVRKKWFPQRKELFHIDLNKYSENEQLSPELDCSFAFKIFAKLWCAKQDEVFSLLVDNEVMRGTLLEKKGENNKAQVHFEKALKLNPTDLSGLRKITHNLIKLNRYQEAKEYLDKAVLLDPYNENLLKLKKIIEKNI